MNRLRSHLPLFALFATFSSVAALPACGDGDLPIVDSGADATRPDGGIDAGDGGGGDASPDLGSRDGRGPVVIATSPSAGATNTVATTAVSVTFDEPMDVAVGVLAVSVGGVAVALGAPTWDATATNVTFTPTSPLVSSAAVDVTVGADFRDAAGNTLLDAPFAFSFAVADTVAPRVTMASPMEGASDVDTTTARALFDFDEPMSVAVGSVTLSGGAGTLSAVRWVGTQRAIVDVAGLAPETAYTLTPVGFRDVAGNALAGTAYLVDGELDFTTAEDVTAPFVVDASPSEAQVAVSVTRTVRIVVELSEAMDTSITSASLVASSGTATPLTGSWSADARTVTFPLPISLQTNTQYALDLRAFRDGSGNPLDAATYLIDGALDFSAGPDVFLPFVAFTFPVEGETADSWQRDTIDVVFNEEMDRTVTSVTIDDAVAAFVATGTWNGTGTRFSIPVTGKLFAGRALQIDFTAFRDIGGTAIDATHPYLADGVLDWRVADGTGETCQDALELSSGTPTAGATGFTLFVDTPAFETVDNRPPCYSTTSPISRDAVVHVRKSSARASTSGKVLHIRAASAGGLSNGLILFVTRRCDASTLTRPDAVSCVTARSVREQFLDVPAGDYFVWVAQDSISGRGVDLLIEEVDVPAGELCAAPLDTTSAEYTAPATTGAFHTWTLPAGRFDSFDRSPWRTVPEDRPSCLSGASPSFDVDGVLTFEKAADSSLLEVEIAPSSAAIVEITRGACPREGAFTTEYCSTTASSTATRATQITSGAGTYHVWVAHNSTGSDFPATTVRMREVMAQPGESCATAIPLVPGVNAVTPAGTQRYFPPACISSGDLTWYSVETTQNLLLVRPDAAVPLAFVSSADGATLSCEPATFRSTRPSALLTTPGTRVCVAVPSNPAAGTSITSIEVTHVAYTGVRGAGVDTGIVKPTGTGIGANYSFVAWLAASPTQLHWGYSTTTGSSVGVYSAPISGGVTATFTPLNLAFVGFDGVTVGESMISLDERAMTPRMFRLVGSTGAVENTPWDTGSTYPATQQSNAMAYDGSNVIVAMRTTGTTNFYAVAGATPAAVVRVGSTDAIDDVVGLVIDANYYYVAGTRDGTTLPVLGRIARASLGAAPSPMTELGTFPTRRYAGSDNSPQPHVELELDDLADPTYLYFRGAGGEVHAIEQPDESAPRYLGVVARPGTGNGLAYDHAADHLFAIGTTTVLRVER